MARKRLWESRDECGRVRQADPPLPPQTAKVSASGGEPVGSWGPRAACRVLEKSARLEPNLVEMGIAGECISHGEMN